MIITTVFKLHFDVIFQNDLDESTVTDIFNDNDPKKVKLSI